MPLPNKSYNLLLCVLALLIIAIMPRHSKNAQAPAAGVAVAKGTNQTPRQVFLRQAFADEKLDAEAVDRADLATVGYQLTPQEYRIVYDAQELWLTIQRTNDDPLSFTTSTVAQASMKAVWDRLKGVMGDARFEDFNRTMLPDYKIAYNVSKDEQTARQFIAQAPALRDAIVQAVTDKDRLAAQDKAVASLRELFGEKTFNHNYPLLEQALGAKLGLPRVPLAQQ